MIKMLEHYWPTTDEIGKCIRKDADGTAEHVLLAVHEPMPLREMYAGENLGGVRNEHDLLNRLIDTEFPIPILGAAGSGKSHVIRWLGAKLKVHKKCTNWHITRIPKGASLRQVLTLLIDGLDGEEFYDIRRQIQSVGDLLKVEDVADYFINFIGQELNVLYEDVNKQIELLITNNTDPNQTEQARFNMVQRHAKPNRGLRDLLGDSHFKQRLVSEYKCIYQLASRFTKVSTADELESVDFRDKFVLDDLDFESEEFNLDNLSLEAKTYVGNARLNTNVAMRKEVIDLLNEVLPAATQRAFGQLYKFGTGNFSDLFLDIRVHLKKKQKTLVILIEDLASTTGISNTLLDSLLIESSRDGTEIYCPMRSAFAVTNGGIGMDLYAEKRTTISTRQAEWHIEELDINQDMTIDRIEDFCGRYLNAARIGSDVLKGKYNASDVSENWPEIKYPSNLEEKELVEKFELSPKGYPLFPYNKSAIRALASVYCKYDNQLRFKPRDIITNILREILKNFRGSYIDKEFPPVRILNNTGLDSDLNQQLEFELQVIMRDVKARTLIACWGYGAANVPELVGKLNPEIAREFSCEELLIRLSETTAVAPLNKEPLVPLDPRQHQPVVVQPPVNPAIQEDKAKRVAKFFKNKDIDQTEANLIRKDLASALEDWWVSNDYGKWSGMAKLFDKYKAERQTIPIYIVHNVQNGNLEDCIGVFGNKTGKGYEDNAIKEKAYLIALMRHKRTNSNKKYKGINEGDWEYDDFYVDYCSYHEYRNTWVIKASQAIVEMERKKAAQNYVKHMENCIIFDPAFFNKKHSDKLNFVCQSNEKVKESVVPVGLEDWDVLKSGVLSEWSVNQNEWFLSFSPASERYVVEGDEIKRLTSGLLKNENDPPRPVKRAVPKAKSELVSLFDGIKLLEGCEGQESFHILLKDLTEIISELSSQKIYFNKEAFGMNSNRAKTIINEIIDGAIWPAVKAFLELNKPQVDIFATIKSLNNIDVDKLKKLNQVLIGWQNLYHDTEPLLRGKNADSGNDSKEALRLEVEESIANFDVSLGAIQEDFCE